MRDKGQMGACCLQAWLAVSNQAACIISIVPERPSCVAVSWWASDVLR